MKVTNVNGTTDITCTCGSWLEHWKKFSGLTLPNYCAEEKCFQRPVIGAHVQKESFADKAWYIVPLCRTHNDETGKALKISDKAKLVPANVRVTCAKEPD
jgi:hypothetical protein